MPYCSVPQEILFLARNHVILRAEVGSTVYGTGLPGHEDHDEMAVYVMPPHHVLGTKPVETVDWRTADQGERSGPEDTDLVMHSAKKYITLAAAGNPSILVPLFTPRDKVFECTQEGLMLREAAELFVSKRTGGRFLGYMQGQRKRMEDSRAGLRSPRVNRPELIEEFGYDTKYAMHMLRLGYQGIEIIRHGALEFPIEGSPGGVLRAVRRGELSYEEVLELADQLEIVLRSTIATSTRPDRPEPYAVDRLIARITFSAWGVPERSRG